MKLVSSSTWYGGPSCVLYLKNSAVGVFSLAYHPSSPQLHASSSTLALKGLTGRYQGKSPIARSSLSSILTP